MLPFRLRSFHGLLRPSRTSLRQLAFAVVFAFTSPLMARAAGVTPASLVPPGAQPLIATTATGVQIYSCELDKTGHLGWVFQHPRATLYDSAGRAVIEHDVGPSWQATDGSRIVGHVISQVPSASPNSIAQLLLETKSTADGILAGVRYVQRIDTVGGIPPSEPCAQEHQVGSSPYLARYIFLQ